VKLLDRVLADALAEVADESAREAGLQLGQFVAGKYLEWRSGDGADNPGKHLPGQAAGKWQPTLPDFRAALLPQWGNVARFAIRKGTEPRLIPPPRLDSEEYAAAFNEVKLLGGKHSRLRNQDQTQIALFWADDVGTSTPPGHWNRIAQDVARQRGNTLLANARLFALLNMSLADSGILCWICKFTFDLWRPVTAIRKADQDNNPATDADPHWEPLLATPPFPAYTSGHSTFSAAAAHVLAKFHGSDAIRFDSVSEGLPGVRRSYASFSAAAEEAGQSRIYGGIHWQFDNSRGLAMGRHIADHVCRNFLQPRAAELK
jgi:hypothetical protein